MLKITQLAQIKDTQSIRICINGKQLLSSILKFVKGLVSCKDKNSAY